MSKQQQQKPKSEPEAHDASVAVVVEPPSPAPLAVPQAKAGPTPEERIEHASGRLAELAVGNDELQGLEEVAMYFGGGVEGAEDIHGASIPNVRLRQKMTKSESLPGEVKEGNLYTQVEALGPELNVIPLHASYQRVRFVQGENRPECSSLDGVTGFRYGPCKTCVHNTMEPGVQPGCSGGWAFGVVSEDFTRIMKIHFTKTSSKAGQRLKTLAVRPPAIFQAAFRIYSEKETNKKGEFYKFAVDPTGRKVTGDRLEAARALSQLFKAEHELAMGRSAARGTQSGGGGAQGTHTIPENSGDVPPNFGDEGI